MNERLFTQLPRLSVASAARSALRLALKHSVERITAVEDRHNRGSTIVTSQLPIDHWHEAIANPTIADAILDRLVHNAHRLTLKGESMRKIAAKRAGLDVKQDA